MGTRDEIFAGERSQEGWSRRVADNALFFLLAERERDLVAYSWEYNANLTACENQSLGVPSAEVDRALASGNKFWQELMAYRVRCSP